jgi:hypothetical protein
MGTSFSRAGLKGGIWEFGPRVGESRIGVYRRVRLGRRFGVYMSGGEGWQEWGFYSPVNLREGIGESSTGG